MNEEYLNMRLSYKKVPCDLLIAGPRNEQSALQISLLSCGERCEYFILLDARENRIPLVLLRAKIEEVLRLVEDGMEIV